MKGLSIGLISGLNIGLISGVIMRLSVEAIIGVIIT